MATTTIHCPECGLKLEFDARILGDALVCPGCGRVMDDSEAGELINARQERAVIRNTASIWTDMIPLVAGALMVTGLALTMTGLISRVRHLDALGVVAVCVSSFLALTEGYRAARHGEENL